MSHLFGQNGRITSGVVYSIVIHFLISAAYTFMSYLFVKDPLSNVGDYIFSVCFWSGLVEFCSRMLLRDENPQLASKIRHLLHIIVFMAVNTFVVAPLQPTKALILVYVGGSLMFWTFIVVVAVIIHLALLDDDSLTQPLV